MMRGLTHVSQCASTFHRVGVNGSDAQARHRSLGLAATSVATVEQWPVAERKIWNSEPQANRPYSGLMPALRTTLPHFSVSAAT